jgi:small-conductance mechanosensitive channel
LPHARRRGLLALGAALWLAGPALAAAPAPEPATLELWNRPIVVFRKPIGERSPAERAALAAERIAAASLEVARGKVSLAEFSSAYGRGVEVEVSGMVAFRLFPEDLDPESGETLEQAAEAAAGRLREALAARVLQADAGRIARGAVLTLGATGLFALLLTLLVRSRRFVTARLFLASERQLRRVTRLGFDPRRYLLLAAKWGVDALGFGLGLLLAYLWLTFAFVQFPYSAPWGARLGQYLLDLAVFLGSSLLHAVPDLFTVLVILLVTRALARVVANFFGSVAEGRIKGPGLDAETAEATRRIVVGVIWLFALTAAFPFIPGSDSDAFRGIGVLAGLMLSLGSAGVVNQAMSGLVVVYSRAFREGDYVRIGEVEGTVVRRGSLSTKIRNVRNEEVTLPNGVVITAPTVNYTRLANGGGALVSATVTIGYDAPWRQVHALLTLAASRTEGLCREPAPYVVQRALSDFYVEYQLVAHAERSEDRPVALSRLHAAIQDAFNEHGVQIMSPHYLGQPGAPVVVPREGWSPPPAPPESSTLREPRRTG